MKGFSTTFTTCKNMWSQSRTVMSMFLLMAFLFSASAFGQTVTTDHADYAPGSTATITGSGWGAGEHVSLVVHHVPLQPSDATDPAHQPWEVVADASGNFTTHWTMDGDAPGE